ncbi:MAG: fructose-bisphosphatase class I, partial [Pseudomonadota bacterium]|nr:fructose-bisphosphatase class I [Pseudomonadota bacterium]
ENVTIAPDTKVIAYNGSNARHWGAGMTAYIDEILAGKDGPRGKNYNMRWPAAAVGDLHRILLQGGMFLYPGDRRAGYENGRLRLVYEAMPMAYLMQAAGGLATDGHQPILDKVATDGHEHSALIFGAKEEVEAYLRCMEAEK